LIISIVLKVFFHLDLKQPDSVFGIDNVFVNYVKDKIKKTKQEKNRGILISYYEYNEHLRIERLIECMQYGLKVGIVCDAG
jgi:16S rRNA C1402 (ribose-2'-O) methylase RsmI